MISCYLRQELGFIMRGIYGDRSVPTFSKYSGCYIVTDGCHRCDAGEELVNHPKFPFYIPLAHLVLIPAQNTHTSFGFGLSSLPKKTPFYWLLSHEQRA